MKQLYRISACLNRNLTSYALYIFAPHYLHFTRTSQNEKLVIEKEALAAKVQDLTSQAIQAHTRNAREIYMFSLRYISVRILTFSFIANQAALCLPKSRSGIVFALYFCPTLHFTRTSQNEKLVNEKEALAVKVQDLANQASNTSTRNAREICRCILLEYRLFSSLRMKQRYLCLPKPRSDIVRAFLYFCPTLHFTLTLQNEKKALAANVQALTSKVIQAHAMRVRYVLSSIHFC